MSENPSVTIRVTTSKEIADWINSAASAAGITNSSMASLMLSQAKERFGSLGSEEKMRGLVGDVLAMMISGNREWFVKMLKQALQGIDKENYPTEKDMIQ